MSTSRHLPGKSPFGIKTARSSSPTFSLASLTTAFAALVDSTLAPASQACNWQGWDLYVQFAQKYSISEQFPVRVSNVALFIVYLVNQSYKPSTISSYVSAIGYVHKLKAIPDPTSSFLILKLLHTCHKQVNSFDTCMPIVKPMLECLIITLVHTGTDHYHQHLFQAMFALAFFACLRIGKITIRGKDRHNAHLIQKNQIRMQTRHFKLKFISYKHSQGQPFSLSVEAQGQGPRPVQAMQAYLQVQGDRPGPPFQYVTAMPSWEMTSTRIWGGLYNFVTLTQQPSRATVSALGQLLQQHNRGCLTAGLGCWVAGNLMHSNNTSTAQPWLLHCK